MASRYGYDISVPASNAKEAIQWTYFAYLAAIKENNGAAMSLGRTSTFLDIYAERDLEAGVLTEAEVQEIAKVKGITPLHGKNVTATDLRGGASMLICGLIADGITQIDNIKYILRGYDNICEKLSKVGAKIELI